MSKLCPKCANALTDDSTFCTKCGFKLDGAVKCSMCDSLNEAGAEYCSVCGASLIVTNHHNFTEAEIAEKTRELDKAPNPTSKSGRPVLKVVSDLLLFFATILLTVIPTFSFAYTNTNEVFFSGYLGFTINSFAQFINLIDTSFNSSNLFIVESLLELLLSFGLAIFSVVLQVISIAATITSIIRVCKGDSKMLAKKAPNMYAFILAANILFHAFSSLFVSFSLSGATKAALALSMLLSIGSAVISFIVNRRTVLSDKKKSFELLKQAIVFVLNLTALSFVGSVFFGRLAFGSIHTLSFLNQLSTGDLAFDYIWRVTVLIIAAICAFMAALQPLNAIKSGAYRLTYLFYSNDKDASSIQDSNPIAQAVFATIFVVGAILVSAGCNDNSLLFPAFATLFCYILSIVATKVCNKLGSKPRVNK